MPWCPKCKNEYVEGRKICVDCGVELVDSPEERKSYPVIFGEQEQMERLKSFLVYSQINSAEVAYDEKNSVYELFVSNGERVRAAAAIHVFLKQEEEQAQGEEGLGQTDDEPLSFVESDIPRKPAVPVYKGVYQNSAKMAEENRSSSYMLLLVGGIGLIAMILLFMDVIHLPFLMANKYMVCGVMGGLFFLFIVMGILSMKTSKVLEKKAEMENSLANEMQKWCEAYLTAKNVEEDLLLEGESSEEMKYFKRTDKMKFMISRQFINLDEDFLDAFVDDYYSKIFEQE